MASPIHYIYAYSTPLREIDVVRYDIDFGADLLRGDTHLIDYCLPAISPAGPRAEAAKNVMMAIRYRKLTGSNKWSRQ